MRLLVLIDVIDASDSMPDMGVLSDKIFNELDKLVNVQHVSVQHAPHQPAGSDDPRCSGCGSSPEND